MTDSFETLREHRALLLACEAIGWLHMAGKAHPDFLRYHGGAGIEYKDKDWAETPGLDWATRLGWVKSGNSNLTWPDSLADFLKKYAEPKSEQSLVGLLQAGHAMASGIEKNLPGNASKYLGQDVTHMWSSGAYGTSRRNLLADPPAILQDGARDDLIARITGLLDRLKELGETRPGDVADWHDWREAAIGRQGWLRRAFLSTLAETRLPNNDVTLWDQSWTAASLFKSAVAGAVLAGNSFKWKNLKSGTRWRVLTVGIGTDHYEARALRIGDWTGARQCGCILRGCAPAGRGRSGTGQPALSRRSGAGFHMPRP